MVTCFIVCVTYDFISCCLDALGLVVALSRMFCSNIDLNDSCSNSLFLLCV